MLKNKPHERATNVRLYLGLLEQLGIVLYFVQTLYCSPFHIDYDFFYRANRAEPRTGRKDNIKKFSVAKNTPYNILSEDLGVGQEYFEAFEGNATCRCQGMTTS